MSVELDPSYTLLLVGHVVQWVKYWSFRVISGAADIRVLDRRFDFYLQKQYIFFHSLLSNLEPFFAVSPELLFIYPWSVYAKTQNLQSHCFCTVVCCRYESELVHLFMNHSMCKKKNKIIQENEIRLPGSRCEAEIQLISKLKMSFLFRARSSQRSIFFALDQLKAELPVFGLNLMESTQYSVVLGFF